MNLDNLDNLKVNIFNIFFYNEKKNSDEIYYDFKGKSNNYLNSYVGGNINLNKLNNQKDWNCTINIFINSIRITLNQILVNSLTDDIKEIWNLMLNDKINSKGFNTSLAFFPDFKISAKTCNAEANPSPVFAVSEKII